MKRNYLLAALLALFYYLPVTAQSVAINTDGSTANASSILDIKSTAKGILIPRMTMSDRNLIAAPATGLLIYQTDNTPGFYYYDGSSWVSIVSSGNNLWLQSGTNIYNNNAGNVGIGTSTPLALLQVKKGAVLFDSTIGTTPVSGAGTRMMWIPAKAAFRAGVAVGNEWDDANIGQYSVATGLGNKASGDYSTIIGGFGGVASANFSTSIGAFNSSTGVGSLALGVQNSPSGDYSTAIGHQNFASGSNSIAMGYFTTASGVYSSSVGLQLKSKSYVGFVTGMYNDSTNAANSLAANSLNRIFQVGNGTADNARSNAMTILQSGNTGIGTVTPQALLHVKSGAVLFDSTIGSTPVSGAGTRMMWIPANAAFRAGAVFGTQWDNANIGTYSVGIGNSTLASGSFSTAFGSATSASGSASTSMGWSTTASNSGSTAMGNNTTASGSASTAMGFFSKASGFVSTAMGFGTSASGSISTAIGEGVKSKSYSGFATGIYNDSTNAADPIATNSLNRIFQVGNGTYDNARDNAMTILQSGNTGIGTTTPVALLEVKRGAVLFDSTIGGTPMSGAGTRMMWIPAKGALRAGRVFTNEWDDANIGLYSVAMGSGTKASGNYSIAVGSTTTAPGNYSMAMGSTATASGDYSTALGGNTTASGSNSTALGSTTTASGINSTAIGYSTFATGNLSTAMGNSATASGGSSTAMGASTTASNTYSTAMGWSASAGGYVATAMGSHTTASGSESTAMGGNTIASGDNSTAMGSGTNASGNTSTAMGSGTNASGSTSTAMGSGTTASGNTSTAMGFNTSASGLYSTAMGYITFATGFRSTAMGFATRASGDYSTSMGEQTTASGNSSTASGVFVRSKSYGGFAVGIYNDSTNAADATATNNLNRIFQVGNGTANNARSNAMTILQSGNTGIGLISPARLLSVATDIAVDENDANNGTITNSLHFGGSSSGEAIASKRTATGNQYGIDFYTGSSAKLSISNSGNVGIGTTIPGATLDVNGTTTTNGLQVGNGTTIFAKMQSGSVTVGASATSELVYTLTFPVAFTSATPKVFATARNEPSTSYSDAFSVSIKSISATAVTFNIQRTDINGAWAQQLRLDWFAVE